MLHCYWWFAVDGFDEAFLLTSWFEVFDAFALGLREVDVVVEDVLIAVSVVVVVVNDNRRERVLFG